MPSGQRQFALRVVLQRRQFFSLSSGPAGKYALSNCRSARSPEAWVDEETNMTDQRPRVLLVEDDALTRSLAVALLGSSGHHVRAEADALGLDAVMQEFSPDLAIVNVRHPVGPDGFAVARRLKSDAPDVPILFLTASGKREDRLAAFASGADDYLTKDAMLKELVPRVRALLRRTGGSSPKPSSQVRLF